MIRFCLDILRLAAGLLRYWRSGVTPAGAYQAMIRLFCVSGGRSNDFLAGVMRLIHPPVLPSTGTGVLGDLDATRLGQITGQLRERGFYVFDSCLPAALCERLRNYALECPSEVRADEIPSPEAGTRRPYGADRAAPRAIRYEFTQQDLLLNQDVQQLMADPSLLALTQSYFGSSPCADVLDLWWHTAYSDRPSSAAAQFYHFDMDRIKWLKFFIYLTDVEAHNGPHSFIAGSHRTGGIPAELLRKGYARLTDEEAHRHYDPADFIEFVGRQGTVIAEDTRGLHKGKHVESGDRLVLQIQFSDSLFGGAYPKALLPETAKLAVPLQDAMSAHKSVYRNFL